MNDAIERFERREELVSVEALHELRDLVPRGLESAGLPPNTIGWGGMLAKRLV